MSLITFTSAKGSPGVTTLACVVAAVWPEGRRALVAECDPAGSDIGAWFDLRRDTGLVSLATSIAHNGRANQLPVTGGSRLDPHLQALPGGLEVLTGITGPDQRGLLDGLLPGVCAALAESSSDVICDAGRLVPEPNATMSAVFSSASAAVLVLRDDARSLDHALGAVTILRELTDEVVVAIIGGNRAKTAAATQAFGGLRVAAVAHDPGAAATVTGHAGNPKRFGRSALVASARELAGELSAIAAAAVPAMVQLHTDEEWPGARGGARTPRRLGEASAQRADACHDGREHLTRRGGDPNGSGDGDLVVLR